MRNANLAGKNVQGGTFLPCIRTDKDVREIKQKRGLWYTQNSYVFCQAEEPVRKIV
ncbi:hypothetical protein TREVI0001_2507 [Treponema vincentii ATCC 35580]|uniref:Uncharacterized protein n=1 Tax=Treponema vincentii ATCC 35580 TaxID=596324 RepID=C8PSW5_9SPIR|nr:hypothetical protein TREVI0001_2507 [Treponema vincentii ATCC 35580]